MENKQLNVGVIGLGMGRSHMRAVLRCGSRIGALCDIDTERLSSAAEEIGLDAPHTFTDYKEMLAAGGLDAVIIATPDQFHREMAEACLGHGLHVMCEKPLALTREDLQAIVNAARRSDRVFMVGQICRFTPGFIKAKELLDAGEIGELYYVESEYAHDYVKILGPGNWRTDPIRNGVVGGGCHAVDLLRWYAGDPWEVYACGVHKLLPQVPYDDTNVAIMKFPNGVIGKVFVSTACKRDYTMRTLLYGTRGTIICDNTSPQISLYRLAPGEDPYRDTVKSRPELIDVDISSHNADGEFRAFASHVLDHTPVSMDTLHGARSIAACFAIIDSAASGRPVTPDYGF